MAHTQGGILTISEALLRYASIPAAEAALALLCVLMATNRRPRVRVAAVGLWGSSVAVATLALYRLDWIGWERAALNILWAGVITMSLVWAVVVLRQPQPPAQRGATATLPPPGTYGTTFVVPDAPARDAWVRPSQSAGPTRLRYESRRRRVPIYARERSKRQ